MLSDNAESNKTNAKLCNRKGYIRPNEWIVESKNGKSTSAFFYKMMKNYSKIILFITSGWLSGCDICSIILNFKNYLFTFIKFHIK